MTSGVSLRDIEQLDLPSSERRLAIDFLHLFQSAGEPLRREDLEDWMLLNELPKDRMVAAVRYAIQEGWVMDDPLRITADGLRQCD